MSLRDMDKVIYPVCRLCRDHEKAGFIEGIKIGIRLRAELEVWVMQKHRSNPVLLSVQEEAYTL